MNKSESLRHYIQTFFRILTVFFVLSPGGLSANSQNMMIINRADFPTSIDPLNSDFGNNSLLMMLLYSPPIETDINDSFKSSVLKSFSYNTKEKRMTWVVDQNRTYSDGSKILPSDLVLAIKRMLQKRPNFPVISDIIGVEKWLTHKHPLEAPLTGIQVNGNNIDFLFTRPIGNPFFQFTLNLFSIIPARCFNLKTSEMICSHPPESGYYKLKEKFELLENRKDYYPDIEFRLRNGFELVHGYRMPKQIRFTYTKESDLSELVKRMNKRTVIQTMDSRLSDSFINAFRDQVHIKRLPKTAIWYLLLNPTFDLFKDKECRQIFANKYREIYSKQLKFLDTASYSFSSKIMPGFLTNEEMLSIVKPQGSQKCKKVFQSSSAPYRAIHPENKSFFWDRVARQTMKELGIKTSGFFGTGYLDNVFKPYQENKSILVTGSVEFWPLDLKAGYKMFFLPDMHEPLKFLLKDSPLPSLSDKLFRSNLNKVDKALFREINVHLYDNAILNSLSHYGVVYLSKSKSIEKIPLATASPRIWYLFEQ